MDQDTGLKEYSDEIPLEIKTLLKGIANDDRLGILISLMKRGKMTFNQMKQEFGLSSSSLSNHLTLLQNGNLIENFYEKGNEKGFSLYDITDIPESVFDALFGILYKPTPELEEYTDQTEKENIMTVVEAGSTPAFKRNGDWSDALRITKKHSYKQRLTTIGSYSQDKIDVTGS